MHSETWSNSRANWLRSSSLRSTVCSGAVITGFGLARLEDEATVAPGGPGTRLAGTPAYMASEQLEGRPVTPVTDLYALGILLFELLAGTRPFLGEEVWSAALNGLVSIGGGNAHSLVMLADGSRWPPTSRPSRWCCLPSG